MLNSPRFLRHILLTTSLALVALAVFPTSALAQGEDTPRVVRVVARTLQLDEVQVQQWADIRATAAAAIEPLAAQVETLQGELEELLASDAPDPTAVGTLILAIRALRQQIRGIGAAATEQFEALLSEDQAGRLNAVRRAARLQRVLPAFRALHLL